MKPGNLAPEFTLKDLDGKNFDLSSLRGKYVVLDFWGSWCGWCIKGIPEMKKAYEKYKGKIEFVGIDCNDTEDKWKKAVAEHQLPWINVRNIGEPDVAHHYTKIQLQWLLFHWVKKVRDALYFHHYIRYYPAVMMCL